MEGNERAPLSEVEDVGPVNVELEPEFEVGGVFEEPLPSLVVERAWGAARGAAKVGAVAVARMVKTAIAEARMLFGSVVTTVC